MVGLWEGMETCFASENFQNLIIIVIVIVIVIMTIFGHLIFRKDQPPPKGKPGTS